MIAIENVRLFNKTNEALERQTATADILKVIAGSPTDVQPVFDAIAESARRLLASHTAVVTRVIDDVVHLAASTAETEAPAHAAQGLLPYPLSSDRIHARVARTGQLAVNTDAPNSDLPREIKEFARTVGWRSMLVVPMLRNGIAIGTIGITRREAGSFDDKTIDLLKIFADQAVIAIENARLFNETQEALARQTATADVLKVIASSPSNLQPVFDAIAERSKALIGAHATTVVRFIDGMIRLEAYTPVSPEADAALLALFPRKPTIEHEVVIGGEIGRIHDAESELQGSAMLDVARARGWRSRLHVPLKSDTGIIGWISVTRKEAGAFADKDVELLQTFADQAVIAIQNVELFDEVQARTQDLTEALTYQTGSSNILSVIASSPTDVGPVLNAIVESACELCDAYDALVRLKDGNYLVPSAHHGPIPTNADKWPIERNSVSGRAVIDKKPVHVRDMQSIDGDEFPESQQRARHLGHRTILSVPLLREGESIGAIVLRRTEVYPFSDKQISLLQTFADQAVIAIGNVRMFEEVQARTRDLTDSLEQQTATSEVLKVISSSPGELEPVFRSMLENAVSICDAQFGNLFLVDGDSAHWEAGVGTPPELAEFFTKSTSFRPTPGSHLDRVMRTKEVSHTADDTAEAVVGVSARLGGARSTVCVPMVKDDALVGAILIYRTEVRPFSDKQIDLVKNFAAQAVIAIENTRLLKELRERTDDLSESLEQQTATSEVLQVISASTGELEPVFKSMLDNATRICGANFGTMSLYENGAFRPVAFYNVPQAYAEKYADTLIRPHPQGPLGTVARTHEVVHVEDTKSLPVYIEGNPAIVAISDLAGARTIVIVPMLRENELIGTIAIYRQEVRPFSEKQISLLTNFAKQAVIAIENTRLLKELRARTDDLSESLQQQTATSEVLQVISSSPGDLAPVFEKMLVNAMRVCSAKFGSMLLAENGSMWPAAQYNVPAEFAAARGDRVLTPPPRSALAKAISTKQVVHVADMRTTAGYLERAPASVELVELGGARTAAIVPMLRDDEVIGAITVYRNEVQLFSDKQIELLSNFAKQAVIAIENARLLKELRQRTSDLSRSLDDLRAAQDRLVQTEKLASLGQLTAGIAHEIKNPLNFVNNFSALSAELTDELNDLLKSATLTDKMREEVEDLTRLLKENLDKVVQHGKRADAIVKNMLLHSRQGSGEHRPVDVNALVEESLNLAYHGARAEKPGFNITLKRSLDPNAGEIDVFPQEITRVLLNLISNGFYAATKRQGQADSDGYEPTLAAATKNLGDSVEIRIRDSGTGIPPEVREKMFNPFFTTKPAGEGTGLGLSLSYDIVVKQHGGSIEVDTQPGEFTEFKVILPRMAATGKAGADK